MGGKHTEVRSPGVVALLALELKPNLSSLRLPEDPLFTPSPFGDATGAQGIGV